MQLSSAQKKSGLKAVDTLKKLAREYFGSTDSLADIEKLLRKSGVSVEDSSSDISFPLPEASKSEFDFFGFSDGACRGNPGPGAWGSMIQDSSGKVIFEGSGVERPSTNNRMEMTGALRCLEFLKEKGFIEDRVIVISDSKYVVDGMNQWVLGWKKRGWKKADKKTPENVDLWMALDKLRLEFKHVGFSWVKGHAGHPQNERCDQLANEALDSEGY